MYVVLVYDISLEGEGQRIWRNTFKTCKKYLCHVQNSVFEGEISKSSLFELEQILKKTVRSDLDSVIIFKSRHERWLDKKFIGIQIDDTDNFI